MSPNLKMFLAQQLVKEFRGFSDPNITVPFFEDFEKIVDMAQLPELESIAAKTLALHVETTKKHSDQRHCVLAEKATIIRTQLLNFTGTMEIKTHPQVIVSQKCSKGSTDAKKKEDAIRNTGERLVSNSKALVGFGFREGSTDKEVLLKNLKGALQQQITEKFHVDAGESVDELLFGIAIDAYPHVQTPVDIFGTLNGIILDQTRFTEMTDHKGNGVLQYKKTDSTIEMEHTHYYSTGDGGQSYALTFRSILSKKDGEVQQESILIYKPVPKQASGH
jgi:hypothetical protein